MDLAIDLQGSYQKESCSAPLLQFHVSMNVFGTSIDAGVSRSTHQYLFASALVSVTSVWTFTTPFLMRVWQFIGFICDIHSNRRNHMRLVRRPSTRTTRQPLNQCVGRCAWWMEVCVFPLKLFTSSLEKNPLVRTDFPLHSTLEWHGAVLINCYTDMFTD